MKLAGKLNTVLADSFCVGASAKTVIPGQWLSLTWDLPWHSASSCRREARTEANRRLSFLHREAVNQLDRPLCQSQAITISRGSEVAHSSGTRSAVCIAHPLPEYTPRAQLRRSAPSASFSTDDDAEQLRRFPQPSVTRDPPNARSPLKTPNPSGRSTQCTAISASPDPAT